MVWRPAEVKKAPTGGAKAPKNGARPEGRNRLDKLLAADEQRGEETC